MTFQLSNGALVYGPVVVPKELVQSVNPKWRQRLTQQQQQQQSSSTYVVVVATEDEMAGDGIAARFASLSATANAVDGAPPPAVVEDKTPLYLLGVATTRGGVAFASVVFPAAMRLRAQLGLDTAISAPDAAATTASTLAGLRPFRLHVLLGASEGPEGDAVIAGEFTGLPEAASADLSPFALRASSKMHLSDVDRLVADYSAHVAEGAQRRSGRRQPTANGDDHKDEKDDNGAAAWPYPFFMKELIRHLHESALNRHLGLHKLYIALCLSTREARVESLRRMLANQHTAAALSALQRLGEDIAPLFFAGGGRGGSNQIQKQTNDDDDEDDGKEEEEEDDEGSAASFECETEAQAEKLCDAYNAAPCSVRGKTWALVEKHNDDDDVDGSSSSGRCRVRRWRTPLHFSRVAPGLYASGLVQSRHAAFLAAAGVGTIVSLVEAPSASLQDGGAGHFCYRHFPVADREPPTEAETEAILRALDPAGREGGAVVHCLGGRGRTAFVVLCYLMHFERRTLAEAFTALEGRRTLLSSTQRRALSAFAEAHGAGDGRPPAEAEAEEGGGEGEGKEKEDQQQQQQQRRPQRHCDPTRALGGCEAIVMVGLPGSGKSTLARHMAAHMAPRLVRVSQDEMGRREAERVLADTSVRSHIVLVDRCNGTPRERAEWRPAQATRVLCVWLDTEPEVAAYRAKHRRQHETLKGPSADRIVAAMASTFVPPDAAAEGFTEVLRLSSEAEVAMQVEAWGLPPLQPEPLDAPTIVKFPRTRHLVNLGAAARDDLILSDVSSFLNRPLCVEEKIDGANFGISVDPVSYALVTQNRSHVVSAGYHPQFSKLTPWLSANSAALYTLLEPGREILFGEWLVAQHSIHYTRLPGYFVAFDLYDKVTNSFLSRERLEERLEGSGIPLIRLICRRSFTNARELAALATETRSAYYDGPVEGVYLRICEDGRTVDRAKIVRPDFLSGNDHWTKKMMVVNTVVQPEE